MMMECPGLFWAAVEVSAETIDKLNILNVSHQLRLWIFIQAALFGMSLATSAVMDLIVSTIVTWEWNSQHTYVSPVKQNVSIALQSLSYFRCPLRVFLLCFHSVRELTSSQGSVQGQKI